jgi:hypothetical protein
MERSAAENATTEGVIFDLGSRRRPGKLAVSHIADKLQDARNVLSIMVRNAASSMLRSAPAHTPD